MLARPHIAITGLGAISALGDGVPAIVSAMRSGRDGLSAMDRDEVSSLVSCAGWIRHRWERGERADANLWAALAAREAWDDAGVRGVAPDRIAIVVGTTVGEGGAITGIADAIASAIGARGPRWTISTACASGANALGLAGDLLLAGDADVVIAGGAERLLPGMFAGFSALGVLASGKCAPFGETVGTTLGEGAGFVVLERGDHDRAYAYLLGYSLTSDGWHETSPDPRGEGIARAMQSCFRDAAIASDDVDYVNAHATGTASNDESEWRGIQKALGARAGAIPINGSKGFLGHAQGAAGALETIATLACLREGLVPPSTRIGKGRLRGPKDTVAEGHARTAKVEIAISNSAAFGGANAALAIARSPRDACAAERPIYIEGIGELLTAPGHARDEATLEKEAGDPDLRAVDPASRYSVAATGRALRDAALKISVALRDRSGIFGGASQPPASSVHELEQSLERGLDRASAPAFARTVGHAPIATTSRIFSLRGPMTMVAGDGVSGLLAIAYAARWLRQRDDADRIVAGGLDERAIDSLAGEGAAMAIVSTVARGPRVVGVATAADIETAIARALAEAHCDPRQVDVWTRPSPNAGPSSGSALACLDAVRAIRGGAKVAVASASGSQGSIAIVLMGEER